MWKKIEKSYGGRGGKGTALRSDEVRLTHVRPKKGTHYLCITIGEQLAKAARLLTGDGVSVQFNEDERLGKVSRVQENGYRVCPADKKSEPGQYARCYVRVPLRKDNEKVFFPNCKVSYTCGSAIVEDDGIVFELDK